MGRKWCEYNCILESHDTRHGEGAHGCLSSCKKDFRFRFEMVVFQGNTDSQYCQPVNIPQENHERCQTATSTRSTTTSTSMSTTTKAPPTAIHGINPDAWNAFRAWNSTNIPRHVGDAQPIQSQDSCPGEFCNNATLVSFQNLYCIFITIFVFVLGQL